MPTPNGIMQGRDGSAMAWIEWGGTRVFGTHAQCLAWLNARIAEGY